MTVSGLEVGVAKMPMNTAFSPSNTEEESALSGPSSMVAISASRISASPRPTTTSLPNAAGLSSDVSALMVVWTKSPFTWPAAVMKLLVGERVAHVDGGDAERRHLVRIEPDAHGEGLAAQDLRIGDAVDGLQPGLHHPRQIVGDLRAGHHLAVEGEVHQRGGLAGLLDDDGVLRLARQLALDLLDLRQHVGDRPVGVGVEPQVEGDDAVVLLRGGGERVDALGAGDRLLDGRGDEALDEVGVGARVGRGDGDGGVGDPADIAAPCRLKSEASPISRISRLTTLASTGRRMKMSVNDIAGLPAIASAADRAG